MICLNMSNITGYTFKKSKLDTYKTYDTLILQIKQCKDNKQEDLLQKQQETHKELVDFGSM